MFQRVDVDVDVAFRMNMRMNLYTATAANSQQSQGAEVTSGTRVLKGYTSVSVQENTLAAKAGKSCLPTLPTCIDHLYCVLHTEHFPLPLLLSDVLRTTLFSFTFIFHLLSGFLFCSSRFLLGSKPKPPKKTLKNVNVKKTLRHTTLERTRFSPGKRCSA